MTSTVNGGTFAVMGQLEHKYLAVVGRIGGYPMPEAAWARIPAEVEHIYRAEKHGALLARRW